MSSLPIFCKDSDGEILALAPTPDGGAQGFAWRDRSWLRRALISIGTHSPSPGMKLFR